MSLMAEPIEIEPDSPVGRFVTNANTAFAEANAMEMDAAYRGAVAFAKDAELRSALALDHVARLLELERPGEARARCDEYLADERNEPVALPLRLALAEAYSGMGAHVDAAKTAAVVRATAGHDPGALTTHEQARLARVFGLAAVDRGEDAEAGRNLRAAKEIFLKAGDRVRAAIIDGDLQQLKIRQGMESAAADELAGPAPKTIAERLARAAALRARWRYEAASEVLKAIDMTSLDPALRVPVLTELVTLLRLIRQNKAAERVTAQLACAVAVSSDSMAAQALSRLSLPTAAAEVPNRTDDAISHARFLIGQGRLAAAQHVLAGLRPRTVREKATWHLAMGEWFLANGSDLAKAIHHVETARQLAEPADLVEIRILALRHLGRAHYARAHRMARSQDAMILDDKASEYWSEAHGLDEQVVACQDSDECRVRMLLAAADEHDERIRATTAATAVHGVKHAAAIIVAMEAARGATILRLIGPEVAAARDLPRPTDPAGARRWLRRISRKLPRSQGIWLLHHTPTHIHHAIIDSGGFQHFAEPLERETFQNETARPLIEWLSSEDPIGVASSAEYDKALAEVSAKLSVPKVLRLLPKQVDRIAVIASRDLAEIPFAALPVPGSSDRLGHRYALSDLPCLSARHSLHGRARGQRGDRALLVRPPRNGLQAAAELPGRKVLENADATPAKLRTALESGRFRQLRIDSHGYGPEQTRGSWLQLVPDDSAGRLRQEEMQDMDLRGCGTVVLGACESGMALPVGRDERVGFVRAAMHGGTASVVAARWKSEDTMAAAVLDRFDRYLRYLPRDLALRRALAEARTATDIPHLDHPARWACWTLHGDPGWQTAAGLVRRFVHRQLDQRRHRVQQG
jgi:CHAT domain-containing protein